MLRLLGDCFVVEHFQVVATAFVWSTTGGAEALGPLPILAAALASGEQAVAHGPPWLQGVP